MDEREERPEDLLDDRDESASLRGVIPDLFRRALISGIGTVFMTEDAIRKTLSDMKMPKEAMGYVVAQADRTKRELINTLARELRGFLDSLELSELLHDSLQDTTFEIHTTIRVKKNDDGTSRLAMEHQDARVVKAPGAARKKRAPAKKRAKHAARKTAPAAGHDDDDE